MDHDTQEHRRLIALNLKVWISDSAPSEWTHHPNYCAWVTALRALGVKARRDHTQWALYDAVARGEVDPDHARAVFTLLFL